MTPHQMEQLAEKIASQVEQRARLDQRPALRKPGRNEPCFCGSGNKFKKCCDDPAKRMASSDDHTANGEVKSLNLGKRPADGRS